MRRITPFDVEDRSLNADRLPWTALLIIALAVFVVGWMVMTSTSATASAPLSEAPDTAAQASQLIATDVETRAR